MRTRTAVSLLACLMLLAAAPGAFAQDGNSSSKEESKSDQKNDDKEKDEEAKKGANKVQKKVILGTIGGTSSDDAQSIADYFKSKEGQKELNQAFKDSKGVQGGVVGGGAIGGLSTSSKLETSDSAITKEGAVAAGRPQVMGSIHKEDIRKVIKSNRAAIKACYEKGLRVRRDIAGRVRVKFTIGKTGKVVSTAIKSSELGGDQVEECLSKEIRTWKFPKPKGGGIVVVSYPFNFSPSEK